MKMRNMMLAAAMALPLVGQETAPAPETPETPAAEPAAPSAAEALAAALEKMAAENADDFYPAVVAALDAGATEENFGQLMREAAKNGAPAAQLWWAHKNLELLVVKGGDAVEADEAVRAAKALSEAAKKGYVPALMEQSRMAGAGIGRQPNEKEALRLLAEACKGGSVRARAAYLLVSGRLNAGNWTLPEVASELEKKNFYLEEMIASFYGEDETQAREWFERAAAHGSPRAAYVLSQSFENAIPEERAAAYLRQAADAHMPEALAAVAMLELGGDGQIVPVDKEKGMRHLQESLLLGYQPVAVTLASRYMEEGDAYTPERILALYKNAAELGDGRAMVAYAYCVATGRGCEASAEAGREMLKTLAFNGMPYASMALADLAFNGVGAEPDVRAAVNHLGEAASAGLPQCYTLMAALTAMGTEKTPGDARRAESFLRMAEENNERSPREIYQELLKEKQWHFLPPARS